MKKLQKKRIKKVTEMKLERSNLMLKATKEKKF